ncbi:MAG: hypothetical protein KDB18_13410 [Salinibacterium sp.]|nr:hypothetical protein [Salinibacterium sp.]
MLARVAVVASTLATPLVASATIVVPRTLEEMATHATAVVRAKVVARQSAWDADHRRIHTYTELALLETVAGESAKGPLVVRTMGGEVGDIGMRVAGVARFEVGEEVVLFLRVDPLDRSHFQVVGMSQGKYVVDRSGAAPVLVRKGPWPAARSQLAWWSAQTRRYRHALRAFVPRVFGWFGRKSPLGPGRALAPPKFHHWTPTDKAPYTTPEFLESYETLRVLAAWDPATEGRLPKQWLADLRRLCDERGIRLFAFLHPQASWSRRTWSAERHQAFEELCHQALADRPLLDLRTLLADSDYFDFVHPNREGARRLTQRLGEFLASHID